MIDIAKLKLEFVMLSQQHAKRYGDVICKARQLLVHPIAYVGREPSKRTADTTLHKQTEVRNWCYQAYLPTRVKVLRRYVAIQEVVPTVLIGHSDVQARVDHRLYPVGEAVVVAGLGVASNSLHFRSLRVLLYRRKRES